MGKEKDIIPVSLRLKRLTQYALPVLIILGAYAWLYYWISKGKDANRAALIISAAFFFIMMLLEILFPYRKDWVFWKDKQSVNDVFLYIINKLGVIPIVFILNRLTARIHPDYVLWPARLPMFLQVLLGFLIFDFFYYWFHRSLHRVPFLWKFHAVHHSSEKLHFMKGSRSNIFLDAIPYVIVVFFPLKFLNPPDELFVWMTFTLAIFSFLVHSNIDMKFFKGWYALFITSKTHYLHHIKKAENGIGYNFGTLLNIWDRLFHTFKSPARNEHLHVGVDNITISKKLFWQVFYPVKETKIK